MTHSVLDTPIGPLTIVERDGALVAILMQEHHRVPVPEEAWGERVDDALPAATRQLSEYFAGTRTEFVDLPLGAAGTEFQRQVWDALAGIPYGRTITYGELAAQVGREGAARAVGAAVGRNPISIVVPCHRVVGSDGSLTGYAGGPARKRYLLDLEGQGRVLIAG